MFWWFWWSNGDRIQYVLRCIPTSPKSWFHHTSLQFVFFQAFLKHVGVVVAEKPTVPVSS